MRPMPMTLTMTASALRQMSTSTLQRPRVSPPSTGSFFAQSYLPYSNRGSFFTPSRYASTASTGLGAAAPEHVEDVRTIPKSLPTWLIGCSALVFGIIVIGGLTRLTESGLSIVEWNPITGIRPPITDAEWDAEWEKYRLSPEGVM
jgi:cytochrome c oxidase assembly protein subunit 15